MTPISAHLKMLAVAAFLLGNAAAQETAPPGSASRPLEAAPMPLTEDEALPPVGKGNMFSDEQLRYCLAQLVRVDAVRPLLDRYEREEVEHFNALVADFNARCASYRYKGNALDEAKAWLEESRAKIEAAARESYTKRFSRESKVVKAPKKTPVTPPRPSTEPSVSARATSEGKPAQATSKPAPPPQATTSASEPSSAAPSPRAAAEDKPVQPSNKPAGPPQTATAASEPSRSKPQGSASDASKPTSAPTPPPPAPRDETPSPTISKPSSPPTSKPKEVAGETSTKPGAGSVPVTPPQAPRAASVDVQTSTAPPAKAVPAEPLISKPKEFPAAGPDTSSASASPSQAPDRSASVSAPTAGGSPVPPSSDDKVAKSKPPPVVAATAQAELSTKPQTDERDIAQRNSGPRKAGKPASKPPRPLPSARKTEPPAQVAAVAPKPETPQAPKPRSLASPRIFSA